MNVARQVLIVTALATAVCAYGLSACSGSSGSGAASPDEAAPDIDASARLVDLSMTEQATLCDWIAQRVGGYGRAFHCVQVDVSPTAPNQAACISQLAAFTAPDCATTVAQFTTCTNAEVSQCDLATLTSPSCSAVSTCYGMAGGEGSGPVVGASDAGQDGACSSVGVCNEPNVPVGCHLGEPTCTNGVAECPPVVCPDAGADD
jgi:hypothetical protein